MKTAYTVTDVTRYIKNMFAQDFVLNSVKVCGEISNCKYHSSGHIYFTLKDDKSQIACVMFSSDRGGLSFALRDGDCVEIDGRIDVYEKTGAYQLYSKKIKQAGSGELFLKFEALKKELEERGMFAPKYKVPIPKYIQIRSRSLGSSTSNERLTSFSSDSCKSGASVCPPPSLLINVSMKKVSSSLFMGASMDRCLAEILMISPIFSGVMSITSEISSIVGGRL